MMRSVRICPTRRAVLDRTLCPVDRRGILPWVGTRPILIAVNLIMQLVQVLMVGLVLLLAVEPGAVRFRVSGLDLVVRIFVGGVFIVNGAVQLIQVLVVGLVLLLAAESARVRRIVSVLDLAMRFVVCGLGAGLVELLLQSRAGSRLILLCEGGCGGRPDKERRRGQQCCLHNVFSVGMGSLPEAGGLMRLTASSRRWSSRLMARNVHAAHHRTLKA